MFLPIVCQSFASRLRLHQPAAAAAAADTAAVAAADTPVVAVAGDTPVVADTAAVVALKV